MNTKFHPEKSLSLPELVFALGQELKCAAYSTSCVPKGPVERCADSYQYCSFSFDEISQLDKDTTIALTTIREWRNSLVAINRIPLDVLSLIPTYFPSQNDRFRASSVCRHWRRTFLQRAELWSELCLSRGETHVKALLGRAKGSALDVFVNNVVSTETMALLSTRARQIRCLDFLNGGWENIQKFSQIISGPLPNLHTLSIHYPEKNPLDSLRVGVPPSQPLFDAVNLRVLHLHSRSVWSTPLTPFNFPSLVSFDFWVHPSTTFPASQLLNFLEASPMLRTVHIALITAISLQGVPRKRVVLLPNVEDFNLATSGHGSVYEVAIHISCPSARFTSLTLKQDDPVLSPPRVPWNAIARQYTRSPVEEVTVEIIVSKAITSKLTFRSTDGAVIELCSELVHGLYISFQRIMAQATRIIQDHPQLANIKRLHLCHRLDNLFPQALSDIANEVGQLFKSVGPLDALTIYNCDLRPYLQSLLTSEEDIEEPVVFPPTKELTISHPVKVSKEECVAVVELAKSQHALGTPFERVIIRREMMFTGMEENLRPWVGSVEYCYEEPHDNV